MPEPHSIAEPRADVKAIRTKNQQEQQCREAVTVVVDHLCYIVALAQIDQLSDALLVDRAAAIVAAVVGLTRGVQ